MTEKNEIGVRQGMHSDAEETLRLLAKLPVPNGLEERVHSALKNAPRTAEVLSWPGTGGSARGWIHRPLMQGAAAAAIVMLVLGGSWAVSSHVQPAPLPEALTQPRVVAPRSGFSSANAMRTPTTLNGPTVKQSELKAATKPLAQDSQKKKLKAKKPRAAETSAR